MARPQALMIQIATGDPRPIGKQIVDAVRMKIATGELGAGDQLPSVRGLAQQLTINPNTVAKACTSRWTCRLPNAASAWRCVPTLITKQRCSKVAG